MTIAQLDTELPRQPSFTNHDEIRLRKAIDTIKETYIINA